MKNILRILRTAKPLHKYMYIIAGLALLGGLVTQMNPLLSKAVVDEVQMQIVSETGNIDTVILLSIAIFGATMLTTLISSLTQRLGDHLGGELRRFLMHRFYAHIFKLPQSYFDKELSGKIINQLNRGIFAIEQFMKTASNFIFPNILLTIFTILLMFVYSWPVAVFTLILFPIYTGLSMYSAKKWGEREVDKNKHEDTSRGRIQEVIGNMRLVKGFANQTKELSYVDTEQKSVNDIYAKQSSTFHVFDFLRNTSLNIVLLAASIVIFYNAFEGVYTLGTVVLLIQLINQIRRPLFAMSFILSQIQTTEAGTKEYFEVIDTPAVEKFESPADILFSEPKLTFDTVSFGYDTTNTVLQDMSFTIQPKEKVAFVGHSGAGKSTVINLITKLYHPTAGTIKLNDNSYESLTHNDIRAHVSLVFQESELFSTTIRENVAYGKKVNDKDIEDALCRANAWDFVQSFEHGINTEIGERGVKLSGGQKQRIQIARAILHDTPIVILDEATSNLDSKSESEVQKAIEALMQDKMVIIIAHRFSTIQYVDRVFVIDGGNIVDEGSPHELAQRDGIYKELLQYQIEGERRMGKEKNIRAT